MTLISINVGSDFFYFETLSLEVLYLAKDISYTHNKLKKIFFSTFSLLGNQKKLQKTCFKQKKVGKSDVFFV